MKLILLALFISLSSFSAEEVGKVEKVIGDGSFAVRNGSRINLDSGTPLELGDQIHSENSYLLLYLYPASQVSLSKNTEVKLSEFFLQESPEKETSSSVIDLVKGVIRVLVTKDPDQSIEQRVQTDGASFAVRGTEFEVSAEPGADVELDVIEGQVEASSPYVQSFVPEIVKAQEGLRFGRKQKSFSRKALSLRFKDHPEFIKKDALKKKWKEKKAKKLAKKKAMGKKHKRASHKRRRK